jgi:exopolysaccharide production protein ExoZ
MRIDTAVTGLAPVVLFFVLSGFVLARSLENYPSVRNFFLGRLFRLSRGLRAAAHRAALGIWFLRWLPGLLHPAQRPPECAYDTKRHQRRDVVDDSRVLRLSPHPALIFRVSLAGRRSSGHRLRDPVRVIVLGRLCSLSGRGHKSGAALRFVAGMLLHFLSVDGRRPRGVLRRRSLSFAPFENKRRRLSSWRPFPPASSSLLSRAPRTPASLHPIGLALANRLSVDSWLPLFSFGLLCTLPMAWLSWRLVERPFVTMGKGARHLPALPTPAGSQSPA